MIHKFNLILYKQNNHITKITHYDFCFFLPNIEIGFSCSLTDLELDKSPDVETELIQEFGTQILNSYLLPLITEVLKSV